MTMMRMVMGCHHVSSCVIMCHHVSSCAALEALKPLLAARDELVHKVTTTTTSPRGAATDDAASGAGGDEQTTTTAQQPLSNDAALSLFTVVFLCEHFAMELTKLGDILRALRAKETTVTPF